MTSTSSTDAARSSSGASRVAVGRILRPHGIRGEMALEIHSQVADRFAAGRILWLVPPNGAERRVEVRGLRSGAGHSSLLKLAGVDDRDAAEAIRGSWLEVERSEVPPAPQGTHYLFDLVGRRCVDDVAGDLGPIVEVREDGGGLLLVVEHPRCELLVPYVEAIVVAVEQETPTVRVHLPVGLLEVCASRS
jgi:16S rRNA processing protein RimM